MTTDKFYDRWLKPYVIDKGDNLLECENAFYKLIRQIEKDGYESGYYDGKKGLFNVYKGKAIQ